MSRVKDSIISDILRTSKRKELETHNVTVKLVDFTSDRDEPAYDVEVNIEGKATMGGGKKQIFSIKREHGFGSKAKALEAAKKRIEEILNQFKKIAEE
jgi:hypothetical protein